ncbi:MAG: 4Fe-4S ferredoxin [Magnetococcales bacterium]|nr:4Fe-4S ferredoxin [Magnetococcales bacterium]NGZ27784.1 4Fe-4S ferredoxin [Magnetococcales bacterium]
MNAALDDLPMDGTCQIFYDGEPLQVSIHNTVLTALEEAGKKLVRGVGCLGGVCGACAILYRIRGGYELRAALMCQQMVVAGMEILPLPYFPQHKAVHDLHLPEGDSPTYRVNVLYPEINRCIMCGECTRLCPQGIDVLAYVGMIKRGDLKGAAAESFICVQCQVCALRCPAQISQPNAALAARRYYGCYVAPRAEHLVKAMELAKNEQTQRCLRRLRAMDLEDLRVLYQRREREPDDAPPGTWLPESRDLI